MEDFRLKNQVYAFSEECQDCDLNGKFYFLHNFILTS